MFFPSGFIGAILIFLQIVNFSSYKREISSVPSFILKEIQNKGYKSSFPPSTKLNSIKTDTQIPKSSSLSDTKAILETGPPESIFSLNHFFQTKTALEIHNKALLFLKTSQKAEALLLLEKNLYHNFFFPSFLSLSHLKIPMFFTPFLWQMILFLLTVICFLYLFSAFKELNTSSFKKLILFSLIHFSVFCSGFLTLKSQVSPLKRIDLKSTPFDSAAINTSVEANSHLRVLKHTKDWLRVQTPDKQSGWLKKKDVFQIF